INGICKANDECYSGYCSAAGKCAERPSIPCSGSAYCQNSNYNNYCACGGKSSSNSPGKCVDSCLGAMIDVTTCLYNQGLLGSDFYGGLGFLQYVDEDSSLFTRCRYAFSRHYSCLRKSWIAAGIPTKGDMAGVDLDAYSVDASPIVPDEANQHQISFGLIFIIMILINFNQLHYNYLVQYYNHYSNTHRVFDTPKNPLTNPRTQFYVGLLSADLYQASNLITSITPKNPLTNPRTQFYVGLLSADF
ncbi:predicted protein, partial [Naegleria gruberi]